MADRQDEDVYLSDREGGGEYSTPTRVPRDEDAESPSGVEEVITSCALGASQRVFQTVCPVLLQDRYQRAGATGILRRAMARLGEYYRRNLTEMEGSDVEELIGQLEEAAAIEDTVYSIRRRLDFLGEDSG